MNNTPHQPRSMWLRGAAVGVSAALVGVYVYLFSTGAFARKPVEQSNGAVPASAPAATAPAAPARVAVFPGSKSAAHVVPSEVVYGDGKMVFGGSKSDQIRLLPPTGTPAAGVQPVPAQPTTIDRTLLLAGSKSGMVVLPGTLTPTTPAAQTPAPDAPPATLPSDPRKPSSLFTLPLKREILLSGSKSPAGLFTIPMRQGTPNPAADAPTQPATAPTTLQDPPRTLLLSGSKSMSGVVTITPGTLTPTPPQPGMAQPATAPTTRPSVTPQTSWPSSANPNRPMMLPGSKSLIVIPPSSDQPQQQQQPVAPNPSKP